MQSHIASLINELITYFFTAMTNVETQVKSQDKILASYINFIGK